MAQLRLEPATPKIRVKYAFHYTTKSVDSGGEKRIINH